MTARAAVARQGATWVRDTYLTTLQWGQHQFHLLAHRFEPQLGGSAGPGSTGCQCLNCPASAAARVHRPSDSQWGLTHPTRGHGTGKVVRNSITSTCLDKERDNNSNFIYSIPNTTKSFWITVQILCIQFQTPRSPSDLLVNISYATNRRKIKENNSPTVQECKSSMCCVLFFVETRNQQDGMTRLNNSTCHITETHREDLLTKAF